ncbi:MAG TPA: RNA polymerase sigma factor [Acidimicrobiales bacterium]|nr:RNA polymerase sigma factor [Acidimicrobiales bacterium]
MGALSHQPQGDALTGPGDDELAELVAKARAGDRHAFEALVTATYPDAFTLATRLMGNEEDAADVVQDSYLRAYRAIGRFRGDARFTTWLYRIVANCAATSLGRRGRHRHEQLDEALLVVDEHADRDPERKASDAVDRVRVQAALAAMPEKLRVVVVLRDIYDLTHEAIAAELGITETAAKVRLHRARKKLRARLYPMRGDAEAEDRVGPDEDVRGAV